jgi:hypothetical protein
MFTDARPSRSELLEYPLPRSANPPLRARSRRWVGGQAPRGCPPATGLLSLELRLRLRELAQLLERTTENSRDLHLRHADHLRDLTLRQVLDESE